LESNFMYFTSVGGAVMGSTVFDVMCLLGAAMFE
jgi:hypothetical protein